MENQGSSESIGQLATDYLARLVDSNERVVTETTELIAVFRSLRREVHLGIALLVLSHIVIAIVAVRYIVTDTHKVVQPASCIPCAPCACPACELVSTPETP